MMWRMRRVLMLVATIGASACFNADTGSSPAPKPGTPEWNSLVQVRFLGVGGFFIRLGDEAIMTAPMYTNPDLAQESTLPIYPDTQALELHFQTLNHDADVKDVKAFLVGHAHYDHLMDVPYIRAFSVEQGAEPLIIGSATMRRALAPYLQGSSASTFKPPFNRKIDPALVVALNDPSTNGGIDYVDYGNCAGKDPSPDAAAGAKCPPFPATRGQPYRIPNTRIQIRAFCARHPPQFLGIHQGPGCLASGLTGQPNRTNSHYLEGETLAYLIDFLDDQGKIRFRIYYQDAPSDGAFGRVPEDVLAEHPVDLALLCAGTWAYVENRDADGIIRNLKPAHVLIGHWEDFFVRQRPNLRSAEAPFQKVGEFRDLVRVRMAEAGRDPANVLVPEPQVLRTYKVQ